MRLVTARFTAPRHERNEISRLAAPGNEMPVLFFGLTEYQSPFSISSQTFAVNRLDPGNLFSPFTGTSTTHSDSRKEQFKVILIYLGTWVR
jgi:hypothetical protein